MTQRTYWITEAWAAEQKPDGTFRPRRKISGNAIADSNPFNPACRNSMTRQILEDTGRIKPNEPFFLVHTEFQLIK